MTHAILRQRLLQKAGLEPSQPPFSGLSLAQLYATEWDTRFEQLMRNRMVMGALRYGRLGAPGKPQYDRLASIEKRLRIYRETGNTELLVDAANLCLIEFAEGSHPQKHFRALDGDARVGVPGRAHQNQTRQQ